MSRSLFRILPGNGLVPSGYSLLDLRSITLQYIGWIGGSLEVSSGISSKRIDLVDRGRMARGRDIASPGFVFRIRAILLAPHGGDLR